MTEPVRAQNAVPPRPPVELTASAICKSFGEQRVLDEISVAVRRGDLLAIVGGSGSGKTVFLHILAGLMPADQGKVLAADHSTEGSPLVELAALDEDKLAEIRLWWAVVFQKNALFSGTVYENIAILLREHHEMAGGGDLSEDEILARARESLAAAALDVDSVLYKDRDALSGGMAKRVAIARAIAIDPALIFYDEPTTGLDPVISGHIHELIWNTHNRPRADGTPRTSVIVTHDKDLLRRLQPRIVMLHKGSIAFDGPYEVFQSATEGPAQEYLQAMPVLHATVRGIR
jgi:phospholipid/cholesterol/gamma-HCH transport system ATP-binding protein